MFGEFCYCTSLLLWLFSCTIIKVSFSLFSRKSLIYSPFWEQLQHTGNFFICYWNELNLRKNEMVSAGSCYITEEQRLSWTAALVQVTLQPRLIPSLSSYPLVPNPCPLPLSLTLQPGFKHCESGLSSPALHRWTAPVMGHDWPQ